VKADGGRSPSSESDPDPAYEIVSPPLYRVPARGSEIVAEGGWFDVTVNVASSLIALPNALVTTARKLAPLSSRVTSARVYVDEVAPAMSTPSRCHW
jgi:hypothetical protein